MTHEFEQIEEAALAALADMAQLGVKTIAPYSGELEVDELKQITVRFPCIYVIADGLAIDWRVGSDECRIDLIIMVGDKNYRGNRTAARGSANNPGVYSMLKEIRARMHRKVMLPGWAPAVVMSESPEVYIPKRGLCLYSARYSVQTITTRL
nr:phage protein Gp37 [uncultured Desulfobacter sp.]